MKQLLVTVLAVIMSVSLASAAPGSVREAAKEKRIKFEEKFKNEPEKVLEKLALEFADGDVKKADNISKGMKDIFSESENPIRLQIEALSLYIAAKEGTAEKKSLSAQINYALELLGAQKVKSAESLNPLFNAAKILLESEGVEAESFVKLKNQFKRKTSSTYFKSLPNSKLKLTEEEIDMLSFVNELYEGPGKDKNQSINDVNKINDTMKEEYRKWKENCKG